MAFDYDKIKSDQESGGHWATYSDLFMVLSLVFLLLYVVASLRTGTMGITKHIEYQQLAKQNADLQEQIRVYNTLKDDYLKTGSSKEEQESYENLMEKLALRKDEAKEEKSRLEQQAMENAQKEEALNKYQQLIRNIINSNMVAQARIKKRESIIGKQDVEIEQKVQEVNKLEQTVAQKEAAIKAGEEQIKEVSQERDKKVKELEQAYQQQKISKSKMETQVAKLKLESAKKLQSLRSKNQELSQEVQEMNSNLAQATSELEHARETINAQGTVISKLEQEKTKAQEQMQDLQKEFESEIKAERAALEKQMKQQQLSASARAQKEAEFRKKAQAKESELNQKLSQLQRQVQGNQKALDQAMADKEKAMAQASSLKAEKSALSKDLKKMKELANAKKAAIERIKSNLAKAGIEAQVDGKTGDVIISFGEEYFETGQASLKDGMKETLKKFMPLYSKSLLEDPKTAAKVSSVEIVGFASPTYKGKFVDPVSLEAKDREAVNYNLDLSYYRARSIFDHIFDTNKMKYKHQKDLLPLVKVTGRSFLADENGRDVANEMSVKEYCAKHNCKKAQRVIIRFDMKN